MHQMLRNSFDWLNGEEFLQNVTRNRMRKYLGRGDDDYLEPYSETIEKDPKTEGIIMVGEIGGSDEEAGAEYIRRYVSKPVVAYIAGVTAPAGKRMGHAGAVISGGKGTAADKFAALEAANVATVRSPADLGTAIARRMKGSRSSGGLAMALV